MKLSVITPCRNCAQYIEKTILSVISQKGNCPFAVEYIVIDGGSTDGTKEIISRYRDQIDVFVSGKDAGPADAINKGFGLATGDVLCWINADDLYAPDAFLRLHEAILSRPGKGLYFGKCAIIGCKGKETRRFITLFKNLFFAFPSLAALKTLNYISQPSAFFMAKAVRETGLLDTGLKAAFDYDFILRLWLGHGAAAIRGKPLSFFRLRENSISARCFELQFKEEYEAAKKHCGKSLPVILHAAVRHAIVAIYRLMALKTPPKDS